MLNDVDKNKITNNINGKGKNNIYMYTWYMKELIKDISHNLLSFDIVDQYGKTISNQPTCYDYDYIHSIYRVKYENENLGIIKISKERLIKSQSLDLALIKMINDYNPETLIVHIYEYQNCKKNSKYNFCISESRDFPITGYVKGEIVPKFDFKYDPTDYVRF